MSTSGVKPRNLNATINRSIPSIRPHSRRHPWQGFTFGTGRMDRGLKMTRSNTDAAVELGIKHAQELAPLGKDSAVRILNATAEMATTLKYCTADERGIAIRHIQEMHAAYRDPAKNSSTN